MDTVVLYWSVETESWDWLQVMHIVVKSVSVDCRTMLGYGQWAYNERINIGNSVLNLSFLSTEATVY